MMHNARRNLALDLLRLRSRGDDRLALHFAQPWLARVPLAFDWEPHWMPTTVSLELAGVRAGASLMISVVDEWDLETTTTAVCR